MYGNIAESWAKRSAGVRENGIFSFSLFTIEREMKTRTKSNKIKNKKLIVEKIKNQFIIITMTFQKNIYRRILMTSSGKRNAMVVGWARISRDIILYSNYFYFRPIDNSMMLLSSWIQRRLGRVSHNFRLENEFIRI